MNGKRIEALETVVKSHINGTAEFGSRHIIEKPCPNCGYTQPMVIVPRLDIICWNIHYRCMGCLKLFKKARLVTELEEVK